WLDRPGDATNDDGGSELGRFRSLRGPHGSVKFVDGLLRTLAGLPLGAADRAGHQLREGGVVVATQHAVKQADLGQPALAVDAHHDPLVGTHADQLSPEYAAYLGLRVIVRHGSAPPIALVPQWTQSPVRTQRWRRRARPRSR